MRSYWHWLKALFVTLTLTTSLTLAGPPQAVTLTGTSSKSTNLPSLTPPPPALTAKGFVMMDANTGKVLAEKDMNKRMAPASLTKMMTLYLTFAALQSGQIKLDDKVRISKQAWKMGGSRLFARYNSLLSVDTLIQGIVVASGNDACVALAEYIGGNEKTFANLMNATAKRLDMNDTHYVDSTGLPSPHHYSTPRDMAILAQALIRDFPEYYHYFDQKWLTYNHIKQPNRNRLLWRDPTVDGIKTGHTNSAGYCLVASAKRNDMRLITVVMGTPTDNARANNSQALMNYGFRFYKTYPLFKANQVIANPRAWLAEQKNVALGLSEPLYVTIPGADYKHLKASMSMDTRLTAPIKKGQSYGRLEVTLRGETLASAPLIALQDDPKGGFFSQLIDRMMMLVKG